jgi:hypothetical protein
MSPDGSPQTSGLLPPLPLEHLQWTELSTLFSPRSIRHISRTLADVEFESLRQQVAELAMFFREGRKTAITDLQLSVLFGHRGGWASGMIARHQQQVASGYATPRGPPRLAETEQEKDLIQFCFRRQAENFPATFEDVIDFMRELKVIVDRFGVRRFLEGNAATLTLHQSTFLEKERHAVRREALQSYFECAAEHLKTVPPLFVWNTDEIRVGAPKKQQAPLVIVAATTPADATVTVPEIRDDSELTLLTAISAFGDSIPPLFISKNKTFEKTALVARQLFEGHDYTMRTAPKTCITEVLFIDWHETVFLP